MGSAGFASSAAAARLCCRAALSEMGGGGGEGFGVGGGGVLNRALESGWADAAVNLEPVLSVHPPITQPILALGLSLRVWMLKPLSLELVCGPMAP